MHSETSLWEVSQFYSPHYLWRVILCFRTVILSYGQVLGQMKYNYLLLSNKSMAFKEISSAVSASTASATNRNLPDALG